MKEGGTRNEILYMLKVEAPLTVSEMAEKLGITEMAIRRHLNTLEAENLIYGKQFRQSMGRPTKRYYLTSDAEEVFPKSYQSFTLDLLKDIEEEGGEHKVDRLFKRRMKRITDQYDATFSNLTLEERVSKLAEIQDRKGYMVKWKKLEDGSYELIEYNCPISQVADQYHQACDCELGWFKNLLETDVTRLECKAKGGQNCIYHVKQQTKE
ncbi:helix-turn-helix transcriptional regulator [Polycladospora coralii]